jgi:hypothetical protein
LTRYGGQTGKMKKLSILMMVCFITLALAVNVSAFGPHTHDSLSNSIFESNNTIGKLCGSTPENRAAYELGAVTPDITVIYYFEEGGKEYRLTHNWNFQQEVMAQALTDDEKCFAWGIASHLIADTISHTEAVPAGIQESKLPNWIAHPLLEKKFDSYLVTKHPELINSTAHMMDALYGTKGDRYIQMVQNAMGENLNIDVKSEFIKLSYSLNTFYNGQFRPQGQSWIFKTYPYIDGFTNWMAPYIGSTNSVKMDDYYNQAKESTLNTFDNWGARYQLSPHGFTELSAADSLIGYSPIIIVGALIIAPIGLAYLTRRRYRHSWLFALLIPVLLFLMILIDYIIL